MRSKRPIFTVAVLLFFLILSACRGAPTEKTPLLRAMFLDVGQGDCTLLQTTQGNILIDCGPEASQETLCRKLKSYGVKRLSLLILTHGDEDHIGGADAVLETFPADRVFVNGTNAENESADRFRKSLNECGIKPEIVRAGTSFELGEVLLTVLYPTVGTEAEAGNRGSLVLRVQCGNTSILMTGDAETEIETVLLEQYGAMHLAADVLHVGHHGSDTSSGEAFLWAVAPHHAVISCGAGNRFGHPDGRTLARLSEVGAEIFRTDLSGDILFTSDGENLQPVS